MAFSLLSLPAAWRLAVGLCALFPVAVPAAPVISEIMFHPASVPEDESREWLEIHNAAGTGTADLSGAKFTRGINFTFAQGTLLAERTSLIVAANTASFQAAYPSYAGTVVGGWTGKLSSQGETIRLENAAGAVLDEVEYADGGDWALRVRPAVDPYGHQGWEWESPADGGGRTLERRRPDLSGKAGQNWQISTVAGGTPGVTPPVSPVVVLTDVRHEPVIPRSTQSVTVYARVLAGLDGTTEPAGTLHWRRDGQSNFIGVPLSLAWQEAGSATTTDATYQAVIPAQANNAVVEYYISVTAGPGERTSWPAPARTSAPGVVPAVFAQAANALYQVDNTYNAATPWTPGARPVYRLIMTSAEREELRSIQTTGSKRESDAAMNATFISQDGGGLELRHRSAVRNRGYGSRLGPPNNFHVDFPPDDHWKDRAALQLNCRYPHSQVLASNVFALGGIAEQQARPVRVIVNGVSVAETGPQMFGTYARIETLNGDWVARHHPDDPDGNLYRVDDHAPNPVGGIPGDLGSGEFRYEGNNPLAYADTFLKRTNEDLNDWSDLINLCRVISAPATGGTAGQPAISDAEYPQRVREVIDVEQWFTYLALDALVGNQEGGLPTGRADDFAIYRGVKDPRFLLIPHDFDTCFDFNTTDGPGNPRDRSIFSFHTGSASVTGLERLFTHPALVPVYYQRMLHLVNHVFNRERLDPLIDELLGGWVSTASLTALRTYIDERRASVLGQIPVSYAMNTNLVPGSGSFLQSSTGAVNFTGTFNVAETRSLRLNGQAAVLNYRTLGTAVAGTWNFNAAAGSGFLGRGLNRVTAEFYDGPAGTGNVVHRMVRDIYVPEAGNFTTVPRTLSQVTVPDQILLGVPDSYVPGVPVLVRVDALTASGGLERAVWNRHAVLTASNGLTLTPATVPLYNGSGSALVSFGSTVGGAVRTLVQAGGTLAAPLAGAPVWRFLDAGTEPDPSWRSSLAFDDTLWRSGVLQAGAGDGDERTIVNNVNTTTNTRRAYYFRHAFDVTDAGTITALRVRAVLDDGAVFYLNGIEVHRDNVPAGPLTLTTPASANRAGSEETAVRTYDLSAFASLIQPGPNLLAVQIHNFGTGNNDLSFDCAMEAVSPVSDPGNFTLTATVDGRSAGAALTSLGTAVPPAVPGTLLPSGETVWSGLVRLSGNVTVPADATLRLAAGTIVLIDGNAIPGSSAGTDLIINGRLLSEGTAAQPVTLTCSDAAHRWGELWFNNAAGSSLLQHTRITQGGRSPGRGHTGKGPLVRLTGSTVTFEDCSLGDSPAKAIYTTGLSSLTLRRTLIARTITGPELEDGTSLLIEDSNIQEILPHYRESDDPAPDDEDCLYVHNTSRNPIVVRRSVLARCGDDLIDGLGGPLTVEDSILREGWDKGISLLNNDLTISRTQIVDCDKAIAVKANTVATYNVSADHVTIISEDHDTSLSPWGYTVPPSDPDPDTPSTGFYTQNKSGQSVAGAVLAIQVSNSLIHAKEPVKVDPLYPAANTVVTWSNLVDAVNATAPPWPGTGNIAAPPLLQNQGARLLAPLHASPCRNSGDPAFPPDPDGSRTDMGALLALPEGWEAGEVRWTRAGSPYRVMENLTVPAGLTLRIDPGVHVQVAANRRITVMGHLLAQGSAQQRILFTGIPGVVAAGDSDPIKNGIQSGPPKWGGLRIIDSMTRENIVSHVDFIDAQGTSPAGPENFGSVGFIRSWGLVEFCTWAGTHLRMCYGRNAKLTVRNNVFPDMFLFDPVLNRIEEPQDFPGAADNNQEPLKVEYPTTDPEVTGKPNFNNGFPAGGWFRVYYNEFNGNRGHNDVFDADSGRWGVAGQFVLDCRYNHFRGISGDEHIDLGGDAYIASNVFERATKDQWTSDTGYSNAISSGDRGPGTTIMVARNYFSQVDHAINLKSGTGTLFEHNTLADFNPDFDYSGITLGGSPFTQAVKCAAINVFVPEDGISPTRGDGAYMGYNIFSNLPRLVSGADARISNGSPVYDVTTKLEFGSNLLHRLGTLELGPNHPGGALHPAYAVPGGGNVAGDPRFNPDYSPGPGSEAAGRAPGGMDFGATIPEWIYLSRKPDPVTVETSATFTVGGPGMVAFKWRLNGGPWSAVQVIGSGGVFPRTGLTQRQATVFLTNLPEGPHLFEALGQDMAGNWQDSDPAVVSGPQAGPTAWRWTISTQPRVQLHEVRAATGPDPDFIELLNHGGAASLTGWRLTDAPDKTGYVFPAGAVIAPGLPLLLPGPLTGIGLDHEGDGVLLYDDSGALVDRLVFGPQAAGYSLIREGASWHLGHPTPGSANIRALTGDPAGVRISERFADPDILFREDWVELVNPAQLPVALGGLYLSDRADTGAVRHPLPPNSYIVAGGHVVLRLNGETGGNQMPFALDAEQEALVLDDGDVRLDTVLFGPGVRDQSQSRSATGAPVWSLLPTRGFAMAPTDPAYQNAANILRFLRITEIMFHPAGGNDYEYLELTNTGPVQLDLAGLRFVEGIDFTFASPAMLDPGKQTVLVAERAAFQARYGLQVPLAGVYSGRLANSGETLALALPPPFGGHVLRFRYQPSWQASTQGMGRSLQLAVAATSPSSYGDRHAWQASRIDFGTPGGFTVPPPLDYPAWTAFYSLPGGTGTDEDGDGLPSLMEFALRSDPLSTDPGEGADRAPVVSRHGSALALTFSLPVSGSGGGYGAHGITYLFQDSTDLVVWRDLAIKTPSAGEWQFLTNPAASLQQEAAPGGRVGLTLIAPPEAGAAGTGQYLRLKTVLSN